VEAKQVAEFALENDACPACLCHFAPALANAASDSARWSRTASTVKREIGIPNVVLVRGELKDDRFHFVRNFVQDAHVFPASRRNNRREFRFVQSGTSINPPVLSLSRLLHTLPDRVTLAFIPSGLLAVPKKLRASFGALSLGDGRWLPHGGHRYWGHKKLPGPPLQKTMLEELQPRNCSKHIAGCWISHLKSLLDVSTSRLIVYGRPCVPVCFPAIWCHGRAPEPNHGPHLSIMPAAG
jgi:hypothetical protein